MPRLNVPVSSAVLGTALALGSSFGCSRLRTTKEEVAPYEKEVARLSNELLEKDRRIKKLESLVGDSSRFFCPGDGYVWPWPAKGYGDFELIPEDQWEIPTRQRLSREQRAMIFDLSVGSQPDGVTDKMKAQGLIK